MEFVAVDENTDTVYVTDTTGNTVNAMSGRTDKVTATVSVGTSPFELTGQETAPTGCEFAGDLPPSRFKWRHM